MYRLTAVECMQFAKIVNYSLKHCKVGFTLLEFTTQNNIAHHLLHVFLIFAETNHLKSLKPGGKKV